MTEIHKNLNLRFQIYERVKNDFFNKMTNFAQIEISDCIKLDVSIFHLVFVEMVLCPQK